MLPEQAEAVIARQSEVLGVFAVAGFSFAGAAPNQGLIFAPLRPYAERTRRDQSLAAVLQRVRPQLLGGIRCECHGLQAQ